MYCYENDSIIDIHRLFYFHSSGKIPPPASKKGIMLFCGSIFVLSPGTAEEATEGQ